MGGALVAVGGDGTVHLALQAVAGTGVPLGTTNLLSGLLAWNLFSEIINRYLNLFIEHGNLMKKMSFPRITLPVIVVGSSLLNNALLLVAMLLVFALLGQMPSLLLLWLIPLTMAVVALGVGIGLILGVLNVFIRDVGQVVPILLQILFWFTPIVYPATIIPSYLRSTMDLNPMFSIVNAYHDVLVYAKAPDLGEIWLTATISVCLMIVGLFMFRRAAPEMVDAL